jgi:hypothetical protein
VAVGATRPVSRRFRARKLARRSGARHSPGRARTADLRLVGSESQLSTHHTLAA